jgi:hypothetical protein
MFRNNLIFKSNPVYDDACLITSLQVRIIIIIFIYFLVIALRR